MRALLLVAALLFAPAALIAAAPSALAFDANGVALGSREADVKKTFPSAHCKPLEWKTAAADRRCDDGRISFGGVQAKITFYLKADVIQAFDVRFDAREVERVKAHLKTIYGKPLAETTETVSRKGGEGKQLSKTRWEKGTDRAVLTAHQDQRRGGLEVSRGNFPDEVYRVR
jgi:hypothetical protein